MFLGASYAQLPPINYARSKGYYIITCDNRPNNPGHSLADETYDISTIDKEAILQIAKKEKIDGLLTFASDVSAPTVAYVAERLNLPGNPVDAIDTLVYKSKFRNYTNEKKIQPITFSVFELKKKNDAVEFVKSHKLPLVVKPIDASGSRGVSVIYDIENACVQIENAFAESISKKIIIEQYIPKKGKQVCGDGFMENGKLKFIDFGDGHYYEDGTHMAPWGETFPSTHRSENFLEAKINIENLLSSIGFCRGPFNIDILVDKNDKLFINEIGPRSGGNYIPTATLLNTGVDMIEGSVECALSNDYELNVSVQRNNNYFSCYMIHSISGSGILKEIKMTEEVKQYIYMEHPYIQLQEQVNPFYKGSEAIGNAIMKFDSFLEMQKFYEEINNHFEIILE